MQRVSLLLWKEERKKEGAHFTAYTFVEGQYMGMERLIFQIITRVKGYRNLDGFQFLNDACGACLALLAIRPDAN